MISIGSLDLVVPQTAIDMNGHVSNVQYVQWMQDAAMAHSAQLGWPHKRYQALGATWVVRSHTIEYRQPSFVGDALTIFTWVSDFSKAQSLRKFKFLRKEDDTLVAVAATSFVFCSITSGKPQAIPREVRDSYTVVPEAEEP